MFAKHQSTALCLSVDTLILMYKHGGGVNDSSLFLMHHLLQTRFQRIFKDHFKYKFEGYSMPGGVAITPLDVLQMLTIHARLIVNNT